MRIALFSPLPPEQNGIADYADSFRQALQKTGVQVDVPLQGFLTESIDRLYAQMARMDWNQYDVVHAELGGGRQGEFLALQWLAGRYPDLPLTATIHDPERMIWKPPDWPRWLVRSPFYQAMVLLANPLTLAKERWLAKRLARMVALTSMGARCLQQRMAVPIEKVAVIPHGNHVVPAEPLPPLPLGSSLSDEQLHRDPVERNQGFPNVLKILYFGFIYRGKGIEDLIDAIALLQHKHPDAANRIALTLAGGTQPALAFERGGHYLDELKGRSAQLGSISVLWQPDVPVTEIPRLIQAHHVLVLPYRESAKLGWLGRLCGTSGVLSWAAACGRGVISSNARAFAEEVSYGNGAVYQQGDVRALADELALLLRSPQLIVERAGCAAKLGQDRNWENIAAHFTALYRELMVPV